MYTAHSIILAMKERSGVGEVVGDADGIKGEVFCFFFKMKHALYIEGQEIEQSEKLRRVREGMRVGAREICR